MIANSTAEKSATWLRLLACTVLVWLLLCTALLLSATVMSGSILQDGHIPLSVRLPALAYESLLLMPMALVSASLITTVRFRLFARLFACLLLLFYASSWGLFFIGHVFLGSESFMLFWHNRLQSLQHLIHINVGLVVAVVTVVLLVSVLLFWLERCLQCMPTKNLENLVFVGLLLWVACCGYYSLSLHAIDASSKGVYLSNNKTFISFASYFRNKRDNNAGPLAFLLWNVRDLSAPRAIRRSEATTRLTAVKPNILPLIDYIKTINAGQFKRFNVIVLLIESLRRDQLLAYGGSSVMPTVDAIASQSWVFEQAYAQSSHSHYADISPLSSRYPLYRLNAYFYPKQIHYPRLLIYDILHGLGYDAAIISSQNEAWGGMLNYLNTPALDVIMHAENFKGELQQEYEESEVESSYYRTMTQTSTKSGKVDDQVTMDRLLGWLDRRQGKSFFVYTNLQNSHYPFRFPTQFKRKFGHNSDQLPDNFYDVSPRQLAVIRARYSDSLSYIDSQIKRLYDFLRARHLWQKTILIIAADTGFAFKEHDFLGNAGRLFEEVVHIPLIVHLPEAEPKRIQADLQQVDVAPMLLQMLDLPAHPSFQGQDPLQANKDKKIMFLVAQTPLANEYAIYTTKYKLVYSRQQNAIFLFDRKQDPNETQDVARQHPAIVKQLSADLFFWINKQVTYYADQKRQLQQYPPHYRLKKT